MCEHAYFLRDVTQKCESCRNIEQSWWIVPLVCMVCFVAVGAAVRKYKVVERGMLWYRVPQNQKLVEDVGKASTGLFVTMREFR